MLWKSDFVCWEFQNYTNGKLYGLRELKVHTCFPDSEPQTAVEFYSIYFGKLVS